MERGVVFTDGIVKLMIKLEIRPAAFDCKTTQVMGEAYDKACLSMCDWGQPEAFKEIIAKRIIEMAWEGERDADELCELALKSLGFGEL